MKAITNPLFLLALSVPLPPHSVRTETVRQPVWAGRFYEADPSELRQDIDQLTRKAQKTHIQIPKNKRLRAIIMPHAGYIYSGWTAAHTARVLPADQFSKAILLGPDHRIGLKSAAICDVTASLLILTEIARRYHWQPCSSTIPTAVTLPVVDHG